MDTKNDERNPRVKRTTVAVAVLTVLATLAAAAFRSGGTVDAVFRSETAERTESLTVTGEYGGVSESRDVLLTVNPRAETAEEQERKLDAFVSALPERIRGDNATLEGVFLNLSLPVSEDGIRAVWTSERPDLIDADGTLYPEAIGDEPATFRLYADVTFGELERHVGIPLTVRKPLTEEERRTYLSMRMNDWLSWVEGEASEPAVRLRAETGDGIVLDWSRTRRSPAIPVLLGGIALIALIREGEAAKRKKKERERRRRIEEAYPGFIDELALYLNAGLVLASAVFRIAETHGRSGDADPFYERIHAIRDEALERNLPIQTGFRDFARETRLPSLLRFSAILDDAVLKGVDVTEKLELESILLKNGALRTAEEKGRKAETKLAFPMVLLLGALLLITLAPVLLEMGE